ncbi:transmembrane protein 151B-like [Copidosoma floridanum]|uniref:transmembrane protein 151B-like n=1 Tax=Copidosoma floridanum TaxID=29053 RepID=UPI0006C9601B|nr:transmembrane protein 151B-like [Copidosoma floridanum]
MNPENEEQKAVPQTLCGALQKEANCKCLVLSVLIYGCLAAVTWCRCANVTKIVINFSTFPIKSTKYVSPCDDGYIYIPVAFMGMLYLVYLVECYHSPIRIDLRHAEDQSNALAKLTQLKLAQPTIWWKAISYHYVRRKRQVMRYRNGDNFTTTQVYYERVNSNAATSFYFYDYCGSKDISKDLLLDPKIPITKINLSKGFAFSNVRSATEFEEARSRFFAEQEFRDDYMEMREGLDLGCSNFGPMTLVAVLGNPWFTRSYVYWCLSALLLSWPLRIIIECKTQYVDYQITKLFGVSYDTPTNIQIHTSASQLSAPGSYMLAPSYSEALLMEPAANHHQASSTTTEPSNMVPSYSEALLYERASAEHQPTSSAPPHHRTGSVCDCPCHGLADTIQAPTNGSSRPGGGGGGPSIRQDARICDNCLSTDAASERRSRGLASEPGELRQPRAPILERRSRSIVRDYSEPDLRRSTEMLNEVALAFLRANRRSLENILENEEATECPPCPSRTGAIPKRAPLQQPETPISLTSGSSCSIASVTVNPMAEEPVVKRHQLTGSRSAYFCLKSILKQNRRRFTLVTPEELQSLAGTADYYGTEAAGGGGTEDECRCDGCRTESARPTSLRINEHHRRMSCQSLGHRRDNSRTLIFASPIQEICPLDPFGGRHRVSSTENPPRYEEAVTLPALSRIRRSFADRGDASTSTDANGTTTSTTAPKVDGSSRRTNSNESQLASSSSSDDARTGPLGRCVETAISIPSYDGVTMPPDSRGTPGRSSTADERSRAGDDAVAGCSGDVGVRNLV